MDNQSEDRKIAMDKHDINYLMYYTVSIPVYYVISIQDELSELMHVRIKPGDLIGDIKRNIMNQHQALFSGVNEVDLTLFETNDNDTSLLGALEIWSITVNWGTHETPLLVKGNRCNIEGVGTIEYDLTCIEEQGQVPRVVNVPAGTFVSSIQRLIQLDCSPHFAVVDVDFNLYTTADMDVSVDVWNRWYTDDIWGTVDSPLIATVNCTKSTGTYLMFLLHAKQLFYFDMFSTHKIYPLLCFNNDVQNNAIVATTST
jgi:hypothetical protein